MEDNPLLIETAKIRAKQMIEKAAEDGQPLDDIAEDVFYLFLILERIKAKEN